MPEPGPFSRSSPSGPRATYVATYRFAWSANAIHSVAVTDPPTGEWVEVDEYGTITEASDGLEEACGGSLDTGCCSRDGLSGDDGPYSCGGAETLTFDGFQALSTAEDCDDETQEAVSRVRDFFFTTAAAVFFTKTTGILLGGPATVLATIDAMEAGVAIGEMVLCILDLLLD